MTTEPETLSQLRSELERRAAGGEHQESLMHYVNELGTQMGYRIHYDEFALDVPPMSDFADLDEDALAESVADPAQPDAQPHTATGKPNESETARPADTSASAADTSASAADTSASADLAETLPEGITLCDVDPQPVKVDEDGHVHIFFDDPALREQEPSAGGYMGAISSGEALAGRVILSCGRGGVPDEPALPSECNGVVLDARRWTPLVIPPRAFVPQPTSKYINQRLARGDYTILQVSDGTLVNLYQWAHPFHGKIWCISTRNGYDVSHLRWMGRRTYAEILYELLARCPGFTETTGMAITRDFLCPGDTRLSFATLDPGRCYTVGFRCHRYHPLSLDPEAVWNIQSADLATGEVSHEAGLPCVPAQMAYAPADINALLSRAPSHPVRWGDLVELNRVSLEEACDAIAEGHAPAAREDVPAGTYATPFRYGFILRSSKPSVPSVLCDSPLLHTVRRLVYQRPPCRVRGQLNENNRLEYYALKAYLTTKNCETFLKLYPQFVERFQQYETFLLNVASQVHHMHRQSDMQQDAVAVEAAEPNTPTKTIARAILNAIRRSPGPVPRGDPSATESKPEFSAFKADTKSIIRDYVRRPEYTLIYLQGLGGAM